MIATEHIWWWINIGSCDQHCFKYGLGAWRHQAITWNNVDPDLCHHITSIFFHFFHSMPMRLRYAVPFLNSNFSSYVTFFITSVLCITVGYPYSTVYHNMNIARYIAHTIFSWPNPKPWLIQYITYSVIRNNAGYRSDYELTKTLPTLPSGASYGVSLLSIAKPLA